MKPKVLLTMTRFFPTLRLALIGLIVLAAAACGSGSGGDDNSTQNGSTEDPVAILLESLCGAVVDEAAIQNPPQSETAMRVSVSAPVRPDAVVVTPLEGVDMGNPFVVKFHGVTASDPEGFAFDNGISLIQQMTAGGAYFVPAGASCPAALEGGVQGVLGQLYSLTGMNITESLVEVGAVVPTADICSGDALAACYSGIEVNEPVSPFTITKFLWKPVAERDGNLVVLANPIGATVTVQGAITQTLVDFGPSNGFGLTARATRPGCAFGSARVYFRDSLGRRILTADGSEFVSVPNGCDRTEF
ncbi:MAG: hypothetical protein KDD44_11180 [Bdellovibrionales bacterium]|nr:hypothetical protein [Bdellovibrionales bacterium]